MGSLQRRLATAAGVLVVPLTAALGVAVVTDGWRQSNADTGEQAASLAARVDDGFFDAPPGTRVEPELADFEAVVLLDDDRDVLTATEGLDVEFVLSVVETDFALDELGELDVQFTEITVTDDTADTEFADDEFVDEVDGETWGFAVTRCSDPDRCELLVAVREPASWWGHVADRLAWLIVAVLVAGVVSVLATRLIVRRALRPVDRMREELDAITATDLRRRVPVPPPGSELQPLAHSLNGAVDRVESAAEAQRRFVSDAAHELRSPLTGLRATLELASHHPDRLDETIDVAIGQIDRTSRLIDDLLVLARHDAGTAPAARAPTDLDEVVRAECRELRVRHPGVAVDQSGVLPVQLRADRDAISRLVRNLLDNAAQHGATEVRASVQEHPGVARLAVGDDGPGIAEADRERVFGRFVRLDSSRARSTGGSGLGLALVADIAADHGATVRIGDSALGGAEVTVDFPLAP